MMALPYIKLNDMKPEFATVYKDFTIFTKGLSDQLKEKIVSILKRMEKFFKYIKDYWLKDVKLAEYNCFENYNRTNNPLESFHKQLNKGIERNPDGTKFVSK